MRDLQELLYSMESPQEEKFKYSITEGALFAPLTESEVWMKILGMAKSHVYERKKLRQSLQNLGDVDEMLTWADDDQ